MSVEVRLRKRQHDVNQMLEVEDALRIQIPGRSPKDPGGTRRARLTLRGHSQPEVVLAAGLTPRSDCLLFEGRWPAAEVGGAALMNLFSMAIRFRWLFLMWMTSTNVVINQFFGGVVIKPECRSNNWSPMLPRA